MNLNQVKTEEMSPIWLDIARLQDCYYQVPHSRPNLHTSYFAIFGPAAAGLSQPCQSKAKPAKYAYENIFECIFVSEINMNYKILSIAQIIKFYA